MFILIVTLIAHIMFTMSDAYWLFTWLDMPVHFFVGVGLALVFVRNFKLSTAVSIGIVICLALGWEYVERLLGISEALAETFADASTDVIMGVAGGIIGSIYARRYSK